MPPAPPTGEDTDHPFAKDLNWLLHRVAAALGSAEDQVASRYGLGIRGYVVLRTISAGPETSQLTLGRNLGLDKTTLTAVLDRLETAGLIVRRPAPGDRRARICEATAQGREIARQVAEEIAETERRLLADHLGAQEYDALIGVLRRLAFGAFADAAPITGSCI
ncbi:MarR family winged helix-turn-helix transcriptional regulator [Streptomyces sp. NPDC001177]